MHNHLFHPFGKITQHDYLLMDVARHGYSLKEFQKNKDIDFRTQPTIDY
jgi:hypothetical protein